MSRYPETFKNSPIEIKSINPTGYRSNIEGVIYNSACQITADCAEEGFLVHPFPQ